MKMTAILCRISRFGSGIFAQYRYNYFVYLNQKHVFALLFYHKIMILSMCKVNKCITLLVKLPYGEKEKMKK